VVPHLANSLTGADGEPDWRFDMLAVTFERRQSHPQEFKLPAHFDIGLQHLFDVQEVFSFQSP
jgi:hypothetical protein